MRCAHEISRRKGSGLVAAVALYNYLTTRKKINANGIPEVLWVVKFYEGPEGNSEHDRKMAAFTGEFDIPGVKQSPFASDKRHEGLISVGSSDGTQGEAG